MRKVDVSVLQINVKDIDYSSPLYQLLFMSLSNDQNSVEIDGYNVVLTKEVNVECEDIALLEELYVELNCGEKPKDYMGRSLSVSDIVKLNDKYYYCQSFGWKEISVIAS